MLWTARGASGIVPGYFPNPGVHMDNIIASKDVQVERKHFTIEFRENDRGQFLRVTEEAHGRRNTVIIPSPGLRDFTTAIADVLSAAAKAVPAA